MAKGHECWQLRLQPHGVLYDLENDPMEMHNRYSDPEYKSVAAVLKLDLKMQRTELNVTRHIPCCNKASVTFAHS